MTKHDAERKRKILDFIAATLRARGYPPSVREIAQAVGLASTSAVHHHLQILERDGLPGARRATPSAARHPARRPTAGACRLGLSSELVPQAVGRRRARPADHRRDRGRRSHRGVPGRVGDASRCRTCWPQRRRVRPEGPRRFDDRRPHRRRGLRPHPAAADCPQRGHRRRPGRGERGHPQAVLQGEGPDPPPAGEPGLPAQFYDDVRIQGKLIGVIRRLD